MTVAWFFLVSTKPSGESNTFMRHGRPLPRQVTVGREDRRKEQASGSRPRGALTSFGALDNDLNTSVALGIIAEVARVGNDLAQALAKCRADSEVAQGLRGLARATVKCLDECCSPMGLMQARPRSSLLERERDACAAAAIGRRH